MVGGVEGPRMIKWMQEAKPAQIVGLLLVAAVIVGGVSSALGSGGDSTSSDPAVEQQELPGDYAEIIASETDCAVLQDIFDQAATTADGRRDAGDLEGARGFTAVMGAADDRMSEVGCYD